MDLLTYSTGLFLGRLAYVAAIRVNEGGLRDAL
jgi:hypothetical protein